ncbi:purine nucleoside permease [Halomarina litorea]|uniref:purine nucleoside permease n=1 Tax=Halomarina litorea TaxID=2961595 RepID=UPI0020C36CB9|nr:purine nucleoside permease [Halomarina sp. BCD28]
MSGEATDGDGGGPLTLRALVLPAFHEVLGFSELQPWLDGVSFAGELDLPGLVAPLRYTDEGVGVVPTGIGKAEAATTVATLLATDRVECSDALFLSAGIAGGPPAAGPLGSVSVGKCVVDWDRKNRLPEHGGERPVELLAFRERDYVYPLDGDRAAAAVEAVRGTDLRTVGDDPPVVGSGTVVSGDEFWHGAALADQVEWLVGAYDAGTYRITEMESAGVAVALDRVGLLDRYVSVRALANYDRPLDDRTPRESLAEETGEYAIEAAAENAYRAGRAVLDGLLV